MLVQGVGPRKALKHYSRGKLGVKGVRRAARLSARGDSQGKPSVGLVRGSFRVPLQACAHYNSTLRVHECSPYRAGGPIGSPEWVPWSATCNKNSSMSRGLQGRPVVSERRFILFTSTKPGPIRDPWATPGPVFDGESTGAT